MNGHVRGKPHFFKQENHWYYGRENGPRVGPFDCIYEIVISACTVGTWECEAQEITGPDMAERLTSC